MTGFLCNLTRLFPSAFRVQFAEAMCEQIEHDYVAARSHGFAPAAAFTIRTAFDLVQSAISERLNPTWEGRWVPPAGRHDMSWLINEWARDLKHAFRSLRRTPAFTAVAIGTLGLAIGVNAGMFSVVNTVLLKPLPFEDADRLVYIAGTAPGTDLPPEFPLSAEFLVHYKEKSKLIEDISFINSFTSTMRAGDRVERIRMSMPYNAMFSTLGAKPILGRVPQAEDEDRVAVISHALWKSWFGGDPNVIGKSYFISDGERTIIGVMGPEFRFPDDGTMLWMSSTLNVAEIEPGRFQMPIIARVKPGTTPEALSAELTQLARQLPERFGGSTTYADIISKHHAVVRPLEEQLVGDVEKPLLILLGALTIVLLIACANVANLFLVRAEGRQRDLAVRRAIGAARRQLIRLQVAEALVVAMLAGASALLLAYLTLPILLRQAPEGIPRLADVTMGGATIGFTLLAAVVAALICSAAPIVRAMSPDLTRLRDGGRGTTRRHHWGRDGLVVAQTALALVLLIASGLLVRSFDHMRKVDPGYDTKDVFTFQFAPQQEALHDGQTFARFHLDFMERLRGLPGVQLVGAVENIPLNEGTDTERFKSEDMAGAGDGTLLHYTMAGGDYFKAANISLMSGRDFRAEDHLTTHNNVIISKSVADMMWPGQSAIGRRMKFGDMQPMQTVIGVVEDVLQDNFRDPAQPTVYLPLAGPPETWGTGSPAYVIKTTRAETIAPEVRALIKQVAPEAPMYRVFTWAGLAEDSMVQLSFTMLTLGIASTLALILGAVGLYGVLSYVVAQRTREIGVRMALGARAAQVRAMVVKQGIRVVGAGVILGLIGAYAATKTLGTLLFGVSAGDAATFVAMSISMILIGMLASYLPARRASNVDPMTSLRTD